MNNLSIEKTKFTPEVLFDSESGQLKIRGESYPENTATFYKPVFEWLKEYFNNTKTDRTKVIIELYYFNSSSSKVLMNLFEELDNAGEKGKEIVVEWLYDPEDEDSLEFGEEFAEDVEHIDFQIIPKS